MKVYYCSKLGDHDTIEKRFTKEEVADLCARCSIDNHCDGADIAQSFKKNDASTSKQNIADARTFSEFYEMTKVKTCDAGDPYVTSHKKHHKPNLASALSFGQFVEMSNGEENV